VALTDGTKCHRGLVATTPRLPFSKAYIYSWFPITLVLAPFIASCAATNKGYIVCLFSFSASKLTALNSFKTGMLDLLLDQTQLVMLLSLLFWTLKIAFQLLDLLFNFRALFSLPICFSTSWSAFNFSSLLICQLLFQPSLLWIFPAASNLFLSLSLR
jgi:hypothetical protein